MSPLAARLRKLLVHRWFPWFLGLVAGVVHLPSLSGGYIVDDHAHRWFAQGNTLPGGPRGPWELYRFADGGQGVGEAVEKGIHAWWTAPDLRLAFFRPITSLIRVSRGSTTPRERGLDKTVVRQLATCRWVTEHQTVIITGATGTGKSYLACAFAHQACRKGHRVLYRRVPRLFDELRLARADGTHPKLLARFARADVLVLDDFAINPLSEDARRDLLEILEDRYGLRATVITSQLKRERWHDFLADPTVADAICDRVIHGAHKVGLAGPSRRKPKEGAKND